MTKPSKKTKLPKTTKTPQPSEFQSEISRHVDEMMARETDIQQARTQAIAEHFARIAKATKSAKVKSASQKILPEIATTAVSANLTIGYLLAVGDSWFDYPIHDVLTNLHRVGYTIMSSAHFGHTVEAMATTSGQLEILAAKMAEIKGAGAKPLATLVSGGGNDIAGTEFGILLNNAFLNIGDFNEDIVRGIIDVRLDAAYRMLIAKINGLTTAAFGQIFPVLIHGYDHPVPDGRGFLGGAGPLPGPWLKPGFDEKAYPVPTENIPRMVALIDRFNAMLQRLAADATYHGQLRYVDLRKTLSNDPTRDLYKTTWANELHPTGGIPIIQRGNGFAAVAAKFQAVIQTL